MLMIKRLKFHFLTALLACSMLILAIPGVLIAQKPKPVVNEYAELDKVALQLAWTPARNTTEVADYMKSKFSTEADRVRGIFIWVASNIQYDVENRYNINFHEKQDEKITKCLSTGKGVCIGYAEL